MSCFYNTFVNLIMSRISLQHFPRWPLGPLPQRAEAGVGGGNLSHSRTLVRPGRPEWPL
ncbi:hypothetical protein COCOBI_pt-1870 (chloroplast) [Coccomyxa sp. Obi]|nr:hypothetical protein COCOBI_pt-1870 [Coccomyxa sp. Obi]